MFQESSRVEFKVTLNDKLEKEIVAFLNNREGGVLYIGIDDKGCPVENPELDSMQLKIADRIKDNILPSTLGLFDIVTENVKDIPVIKIIVSSGLEKPYYIKSKGMSPITSYGGLISGQSREDFFSCSSMPRNRELMRVFKDVGLVEQLGSGMSRILRFYDKSIFEISDHFIKVVFPFLMPKGNRNIASGDNNGDNNGDENRVLLLLEKEPNLTAKKISEQTGFSTRKISRIIKSLRETGKIIRVGSARKGYWKVTK